MGPNGWQESQGTWLLDPRVAREGIGLETVRSGLSATAAENEKAQGGTKALSLPGWREEEAVNAAERRHR